MEWSKKKHVSKTKCCAFSVYHALKAKVCAGEIKPLGEAVANHHSDINLFAPSPFLRQAWSVYAETYQAGAGDFAISVVKFSLPKFINFLVVNMHKDVESDLTQRNSAPLPSARAVAPPLPD